VGEVAGKRPSHTHQTKVGEEEEEGKLAYYKMAEGSDRSKKLGYNMVRKYFEQSLLEICL
jgi:hypothetical protein